MFGGLLIAFDDRVLAPRAWTTLQAEWGAELLADAPPGPVLELGAGAGQIGLLTISRVLRGASTGSANGGARSASGTPGSAGALRRSLVCVDASPVACSFIRRNANVADVSASVEVRQRDVASAIEPDERFALVLADPPWVPSEHTHRHPDDPRSAIDGGPDGLGSAREFLRAATPRLVPGGSILLQLGSHDQARTLGRDLDSLSVVEVREGEGGVVLRLA
jgi:methylase of polypeptide subunit release factors